MLLKMDTICILMYIVFQWNLFSYSSADQQRQCNIISTDVFHDCNSVTELTNEEHMVYNNTGVYTVHETNHSNGEGECGNERICQKIFNIIQFPLKGFVENVMFQILEMLRKCCGKCAKHYYLMHVFTDLSYVSESLLNSADIIFPVIGRSAAVDQLFGFHYIPVYQVPSGYYITLKMTKVEIVIKIIKSCYNMWPMLIICILVAFIAGFIAWITERWKNDTEFPRPFFSGMYEAFWWSFVSMTTVGYGDKAPKSFAGRMFAVLWILIGITMCSILTASITTDIIDVRSSLSPSLRRKIVGSLKYNLQDSTMIAQHEGNLHEIEYNDTVIGIVKLIQQLQRKDIDGFLINRSTYYYYMRMINENIKYKNYKENISNVHMVRTEKFILGEQLVAGMLVKDEDRYEYFKKYFKHNWLHVQGCHSYDLIFEDTNGYKDMQSDYVSPIVGLFYPFLYGTLITLGVISSIGLFYEVNKYNTKRKLFKISLEYKEERRHNGNL